MASFADAYWIKPNWLKTEQVVIHDPEPAQVLEGIKVVQISDIHRDLCITPPFARLLRQAQISARSDTE